MKLLYGKERLRQTSLWWACNKPRTNWLSLNPWEAGSQNIYWPMRKPFPHGHPSEDGGMVQGEQSESGDRPAQAWLSPLPPLVSPSVPLQNSLALTSKRIQRKDFSLGFARRGKTQEGETLPGKPQLISPQDLLCLLVRPSSPGDLDIQMRFSSSLYGTSLLAAFCLRWKL